MADNNRGKIIIKIVYKLYNIFTAPFGSETFALHGTKARLVVQMVAPFLLSNPGRWFSYCFSIISYIYIHIIPMIESYIKLPEVNRENCRVKTLQYLTQIRLFSVEKCFVFLFLKKIIKKTRMKSCDPHLIVP